MTDRDLRDVAALADGSLPEARRAEVEARVARSSELRELYAKQRTALAAIATAAAPAPDALRARIAAGRAPRRRRRAILIPALGAAAAAAAIVVALVLPGGSPESPGVAEAAALGGRSPTEAPPGRYEHDPAQLDRAVGDIRFPSWDSRFGWRATGARTDRLGGRTAATVFYGRGGRRIGYTIVARPELRVPRGAAPVRRGALELRTFRHDGRAVVTWRRDGRTCILSGRGVEPRTLLALAEWRAGGRLRY